MLDDQGGTLFSDKIISVVRSIISGIDHEITEISASSPIKVSVSQKVKSHPVNC